MVKLLIWHVWKWKDKLVYTSLRKDRAPLISNYLQCNYIDYGCSPSRRLEVYELCEINLWVIPVKILFRIQAMLPLGEFRKKSSCNLTVDDTLMFHSMTCKKKAQVYIILFIKWTNWCNSHFCSSMLTKCHEALCRVFYFCLIKHVLKKMCVCV